MSKASPVPVPWWHAETIILFGIVIPILPMGFALVALWVGREIARNPRRQLTRRQKAFLNIGLILVTFLIVTGQLFGGEPLEIGWASVMGFGIGMNGLLIFEIFQNVTYAFVSRAAGHDADTRGPDSR